MSHPDADIRGFRPGRGSTTAAAGGALALAVVLAGCGGSSSQAPSSSTSTTATIGAPAPSSSASPSPSTGDQQAQAYAAATAAYDRYWNRLVEIINKRQESTLLRGSSRGEAFIYGVAVARESLGNRYTVTGRIKDVYLRPLGFTYGGRPRNPSVVRLQACQDLSTAGYVDSKGKRVPKAPGGAKFLRLDMTATNLTSSVTTGWLLDGFKTTPVESCS